MITKGDFYKALGALLGLIIGLAIACLPIWWLWNWLAPVYFYFLPKVYLNLPFWHVFGLAALFTLLKSYIWVRH